MNRDTKLAIINYVTGTALIGCAAVLTLGSPHTGAQVISAAGGIGMLWVLAQVCAD